MPRAAAKSPVKPAVKSSSKSSTKPSKPRARAKAPSPKPAASGALPLHAEPGHLMRRAHQLAVSVFHEIHGRNVTPVQYAVLRALQDKPGIDQVTLAQRVGLDTSTTADIAARLETKGWIVRELLPRRQRSLVLTPAGVGVLARMLPQVNPMNRHLLSALEPKEQAELVRLLGKLVRVDPAAGGGIA